MAQIDDLQAYTNFELPRRSVFLTEALTGYDGDPNNPAAPNLLKNAPVGTWFLQYTGLVQWRKLAPGATTWEEGSGGASGALATTDAITFTVDRVAGTDTPSEERPGAITEGDYTAYPFETIQAAIDTIPPFLRHDCTINLEAAGNYAGFSIAGFFGPGELEVNGIQAQVTPASGPATGTATSGTVTTLTLTAAGWTVDDFVGQFCRIISGTGAGQHVIIAANTADTLTFAGRMSSAPDGTSVFEITAPTTVINTNSAAFVAGIHHTVCLGTYRINDFHVEGPSNGLVQINTRSVLELNRVTQKSGFYGYVCQDSFKAAWNQIGSLGSSSHGILYFNVSFAGNPGFQVGWLVVDAAGSGDGIQANNCGFGGCKGVYVRDCGNNGVQIAASEFSIFYLVSDGNTDGVWCSNGHLWLTDSIASNNTLRGLGCAFGGRVDVVGSLGGTGNGTWGAHPGAGSGMGGQITTEDVPTITGASGEATVDGTNALVWATDFGVAGDYSQYYPTQAHILRTA